MNVWSIIVAAGTGSRFGGPKQLAGLAGRRMVEWSVAPFYQVGSTVLVGPEGQRPESFFSTNGQLFQGLEAVSAFVEGGDTRSASVNAGLQAVPSAASHVLVHDAARPLISGQIIDRVVSALARGADGAIPVVPVVDSLRTVEGQPVDRSKFVCVQTPQGFRASVLKQAYADSDEATDDATLVSSMGGTVVYVDGASSNNKVTHPDDLVKAEALLKAYQASGFLL